MIEVDEIPLSYEMQRAMMIAEEQADLEFADLRLTGFELDEVEAMRARVARKLDQALFWGPLGISGGPVNLDGARQAKREDSAS